MWRYIRYTLLCPLLLALLCPACAPREENGNATPQETMDGTTVTLPGPDYDSDVSIEQSLLHRRSVRSYTGGQVTLAELSQLLWAAQGITSERGQRTAPSSGALYPLEVYVVAGDVESLPPGIYKYRPHEHDMLLTERGDKRAGLSEAALSQSCVRDCSLAIVIAAVYSRTISKYRERGTRYVHIEVGHAAQNICLQATALELGTVTVGAFDDEEVSRLLDLPDGEQTLYILPVGRKG